jgi:hypothetical protein
MVGIPLQPKGPGFELFFQNYLFLFTNEMDKNKFLN